MLDAAVAAYLRSAGLSPVAENTLGDYQHGRGPMWAVNVETDSEVSRLDRSVPWYAVRLQVRARDDDKRAAWRACDRALEAILAIPEQVEWTDPQDGRTYRYRIVQVRPRQRRPNWYPTQGGGETVTTNFDLWIREPE